MKASITHPEGVVNGAGYDQKNSQRPYKARGAIFEGGGYIG